MICIHCGLLCDWYPGFTCPSCLEKIDQANEIEHLRYLLGEAYESVSNIWLRRRIEIALGIVHQEMLQRRKLEMSRVVTP